MMDERSMDGEAMDLESMGKMLREVDPPPPTPREEMWARIQAERARVGITDLASRRRRIRWVQWGAAIAATLVVGVGLGRISLTGGDGMSPGARAGTESNGSPDVAAVDGVGEPGVDASVPTAYRIAAASHLERTETLLASLSVGRPGGVREISSWARELLTDTRLLLSSPAAQDPATRRLLEDLELILAQVAGIPETRADQEVELIHEGINQSDVLLRLRAATAGPRLVGT